MHPLIIISKYNHTFLWKKKQIKSFLISNEQKIIMMVLHVLRPIVTKLPNPTQ